MLRSIHLTCVALALPVLFSCEGERPARDPEPQADAAALPDVSREPTPGSDALVAAAEAVLHFLRGGGEFQDLPLADTVRLRVAPEGGGSEVAVARETLSRREAWVVPSPGGSRTLVPPAGLGEITFAPGVHFNCREFSLETVAPDLSDLPHVGVRLAPEEAASCLQTWNLTLVFEAGGSPPRLVAVVYDQWEW